MGTIKWHRHLEVNNSKVTLGNLRPQENIFFLKSHHILFHHNVSRASYELGHVVFQ